MSLLLAGRRIVTKNRRRTGKAKRVRWPKGLDIRQRLVLSFNGSWELGKSGPRPENKASRSPCLELNRGPYTYGSLIWPIWLRGVRDPPSSFEFSIANACAIRRGMSLHSISGMNSDADHGCTGSLESVPVRIGTPGNASLPLPCGDPQPWPTVR